jgi:hypothetical protein
MKTVLEQLIELKDKISAIEIAVCGETICDDGQYGCVSEDEYVEGTNEDNGPDPVCDGYSGCGCGCDESPVEVEDETPKSAISQYVITHDDKYAGHVYLTKVELIDFATRLTERVIASVKEAVSNTDLNEDDLVEIGLNSWSKTIEVDLDKDTLTNNINSEIEDTINLDPDSISDEIDDIFGDMYLERIS